MEVAIQRLREWLEAEFWRSRAWPEASTLHLLLTLSSGGRDLGTQVVSSVSSRHLVPRPPSPPANSLSREDLNRPFQNHPYYFPSCLRVVTSNISKQWLQNQLLTKILLLYLSVHLGQHCCGALGFGFLVVLVSVVVSSEVRM